MKTFIQKFVLYLLMTILFHSVYSVCFPVDIPKDVQKADQVLDNLPDILIFGDSTFDFKEKTQTQKIKISDFISNQLPEKKIAAIHSAGYTMDQYLAFLRYLDQRKQIPQTVIVPVNLRSFSKEWHQNPFYNFDNLHYFLANHSYFRYLFFRPYQILKTKPSIKQENDRYLRQRIIRQGKDIGAVEDFHFIKYSDYKMNPRQLKQAVAQDYGERFNFLYLYTLDHQHPKLHALREIVKICKKYNTHLICYILPVDYQTGEKYFSKNVSLQIKENISVIQSTLQYKHLTIIDLSLSLKHSYFAWEEEEKTLFLLNGHLNTQGKKYVAEKIIAAIQK